MKQNFVTSMFSEGGKVSHKRFISVLITFVIAIGSGWVIFEYREQASGIINSLLIFVAVMSGVATVAQIVALVRGGTVTKEEYKQPPEMGESLPGDPNKPKRPPGS